MSSENYSRNLPDVYGDDQDLLNLGFGNEKLVERIDAIKREINLVTKYLEPRLFTAIEGVADRLDDDTTMFNLFADPKLVPVSCPNDDVSKALYEFFAANGDVIEESQLIFDAEVSQYEDGVTGKSVELDNLSTSEKLHLCAEAIVANYHNGDINDFIDTISFNNREYSNNDIIELIGPHFEYYLAYLYPLMGEGYLPLRWENEQLLLGRSGATVEDFHTDFADPNISDLTDADWYDAVDAHLKEEDL